MDSELVVTLLGVILPVYPSLFVIYQKIGKYDALCEEVWALRDEHDRVMQGERHGSPNCADR